MKITERSEDVAARARAKRAEQQRLDEAQAKAEVAALDALQAMGWTLLADTPQAGGAGARQFLYDTQAGLRVSVLVESLGFDVPPDWGKATTLAELEAAEREFEQKMAQLGRKVKGAQFE